MENHEIFSEVTFCPDGDKNWTLPEYKRSKIPLEVICAQQKTLILRPMDSN
jgi:hypothetical protein